MRPLRPVEPNIRRASNALLRGDLVVLPTETVYGLAADAANPEAVERIYEAKGRPSENPLIVHVSQMESLSLWVAESPRVLNALAEAFWPGPLTVVLPKSHRVPKITTGGLETVAIRIPSHSATLAVIDECGLGLAMPSANRFMGLSPTRADRIDPELATFCDCIIDGGPCRVGIESTILDLSSSSPQILRPGMISAEEIQAVIGRFGAATEAAPRVPGSYRRHYAPTKPARLVDAVSAGEAGLVFRYADSVNQIQMANDPAMYARKLYVSLSDLESRDIDEILIERPPDEPEWQAVWDRLRKATATEL